MGRIFIFLSTFVSLVCSASVAVKAGSNRVNQSEIEVAPDEIHLIEEFDLFSSAATTPPPLGFRSPETPLFLELADDSARKEFIELESNPNLPIKVKKMAQKAWSSKHGKKVSDAYAQYMVHQDYMEGIERKRMDDIALTLSPEAQAADKEIRAILSNSTLTKKQMDIAVDKKMTNLSKSVYYELIFANQ